MAGHARHEDHWRAQAAEGLADAQRGGGRLAVMLQVVGEADGEPADVDGDDKQLAIRGAQQHAQVQLAAEEALRAGAQARVHDPGERVAARAWTVAAVGVARQSAAEEAQAERNQAAVQVEVIRTTWQSVLHRHLGGCGRRREAGGSERPARELAKLRMRPHTRAAARAAADAHAPRVCGVSSARRGHARPAKRRWTGWWLAAYPSAKRGAEVPRRVRCAARPDCSGTCLLTVLQRRRGGSKAARARARARGAAASAARAGTR